MPIIVPTTRKEIADRIRTDVQNALPQSNPFLKESWIDALISGIAGRDFDLYKFLQLAFRQLFPDTAIGEFLDRWGNFKGINRNPATTAAGLITATGIDGSIVPIASLLSNQADVVYETQENKTISSQATDVATLTRAGSTVTVTMPADTPHHYVVGLSQTISNAVNPEYNVTAPVTSVISELIYTYEISTTPPTPDGGANIKSTATFASINLRSQTFGENTNAANGDILTFAIAISGVNATATVQFPEISGGADIESDDDFSKRIQEAYQNPISNFNAADIIRVAKTVPGVTRGWVQPITPGVGDTSVYFVRDNDGSGYGTDILPDPQEVQDVRDIIELIAPANMDVVNDLHISAPTPLTVDFAFTAIEPDTSTMRDALFENLKQFFKESVDVGFNIREDGYRAIIFQTVDPNSGQPLKSFILSSPIGDIAIALNELGILGTVTF